MKITQGPSKRIPIPPNHPQVAQTPFSSLLLLFSCLPATSRPPHTCPYTNMQHRTTPLPHPPHHSLRLWWSKRADLHLLTKQRKTMDVTFVLEESGVTATVEVPCEADVAAAKEVACTALAVSPASVEMRIGTQVLEETCRLQDTAFGEGVQVVLARRFADIKCPAEYTTPRRMRILSLSPCGTLCVFCTDGQHVVDGFDTEAFANVFDFTVGNGRFYVPAISPCKTRCYLACEDHLLEVALPGGEVLRKVNYPSVTLRTCSISYSVFARGGVVASQGTDKVSVYDEDLTLLRTLLHEGCWDMAVSDCGGWVITSSPHTEKNARLWDVNTGEAVACVPVSMPGVALSRSASVFAVVEERAVWVYDWDGVSVKVQLYDWSGAFLGSFDDGVGYRSAHVRGMQFTPDGKYLLVDLIMTDVTGLDETVLLQYDVATKACVLAIPDVAWPSFAISPCSRVVIFTYIGSIVTRKIYPYNRENKIKQ